MIYKIAILLLFVTSCLLSQQAELFKNPPPELNIPAILIGENEDFKTKSLGQITPKWGAATSPSAESLLETFKSGTDAGLSQMVKNVLLKASIPEEKINRVKISFTSQGTEELSINKDEIKFGDDFTKSYTADKLYLVTKLFRTKSVKIELVYEGQGDFDKDVSDALSGGLRFGNKTESSVGNTITIEIPNLVYAYEKIPITVNRVAEYKATLILGVLTDIGINSIATLKVLEGRPGDFFLKVGSSLQPEPIEVNISTEVRSMNVRLSNSETYSISFSEKLTNEVVFLIKGFKINFE